MKLAISIDLGSDDEDEEAVITAAKSILADLLEEADERSVKASLVRDGDRSQGNLLAPKLVGATGEHYRNKKVDIREIFKKD